MNKSDIEITLCFLGEFPKDVQFNILSAATEGELPDRRNALRKVIQEALDNLIPGNKFAFLGSSSYQTDIEMIEIPAIPLSESAKATLEQSLRWWNKKTAMERTISFLTYLTCGHVVEIIHETSQTPSLSLDQAVRCAVTTQLQHDPPAVGDDQEPNPLFHEGILNGYVETLKNSVNNELRVTGRDFATTHTRFPLANRQTKASYQTPLVKIAEQFHRGRVNADATLQSFEFLLQKGANVDAKSASDLPESELYSEPLWMPPVINHLIEMMKWTDSRAKMVTLCKMAELACKKGAILFLCQNCFRVKGSKFGLKKMANARMKHPENLIEIALRPQCPPMLLRLFLEQRSAEVFARCPPDAGVRGLGHFGLIVLSGYD
ncbi:hypothetical protein N0V84_005357 [Fusarium piperis]|uniref:Uncharacterized protein n=1 Tax=Fusarium piperis TaxID=1435070 RepID=A0A9W9BQD4_9HYPO|nr:hypothetical protein N0V84_005357 [Fusarium piperis]